MLGLRPKHNKLSRRYEEDRREFFSAFPNASDKKIFEKGKELTDDYGFTTYF